MHWIIELIINFDKKKEKKIVCPGIVPLNLLKEFKLYNFSYDNFSVENYKINNRYYKKELKYH